MSDITLTPEQAAPRIASLLAAHESRTLEFKRMGDSKVVKKLLEAICAFANTQGGVMALGVADEKQGKGPARLYGIQENPEALDELMRKVRTQYHPPIDTIRFVRLPCTLRDGNAGQVVLVQVPQSDKVHSIHRDYRLNRDILIRIFDDRLEVDSPGVFPGNITPSNIAKAGSKARNPLIVKVLRDFPVPPNFDLNEGVPMMFAEMATAHLYPPQYRQHTEVATESVIVTLLNLERPTVWDEVSDWIDRNGELANADLCRIAGVDTLKASKMLKAWVDQGVLEQVPDRAKRNTAYIKPAQPVQGDLLSNSQDNKL